MPNNAHVMLFQSRPTTAALRGRRAGARQALRRLWFKLYSRVLKRVKTDVAGTLIAW